MQIRLWYWCKDRKIEQRAQKHSHIHLVTHIKTKVLVKCSGKNGLFNKHCWATWISIWEENEPWYIPYTTHQHQFQIDYMKEKTKILEYYKRTKLCISVCVTVHRDTTGISEWMKNKISRYKANIQKMN